MHKTGGFMHTKKVNPFNKVLLQILRTPAARRSQADDDANQHQKGDGQNNYILP
jgi:hypothetical protein